MNRDQEYYRWSRDQPSTSSRYNPSIEMDRHWGMPQQSLTTNRYNTTSSRGYDHGDTYYRNYNKSRQPKSRYPGNPWQASCEEERDSLAREYRPPKPDQVEIPNQGTVNQDPLIITLVNLERRFVILSDPLKPSNKSVKPKKGIGRKSDTKSRDIPSLKIETDDGNLFDRRKPTPYSFTRSPSGKATKESFLSPESLAPRPSASMPRSVPNENGIEQLRRHQRNQSSVSLTSMEAQSTDEDSDHTGSMRIPLDQRKTRLDSSASIDPSSYDPRTFPRANRSTSRSSINPGSNRVESVKYGTSPRPSPPPSPRVGDLGRFPKSSSRPQSPASSDPVFPFESDSPTSSYILPPKSKTTTSTKLPPRPDAARKLSNLPYPDDIPVRTSSALPYPEDNHPIAMPEEMHFQIASPTVPPRSNPPLTRTTSTTSQSSSRTIRPTQTRAVSANLVGQGTSRTANPINRTASSSSSLPSPPLELHPPCPRRTYFIGFNDWFTLEGCPNFDVCPDCLKQIIIPSPFGRLFSPAKNRLNASIRCDFGNPWIRHAWLITLKEQRKDLNLIKDLVKVLDNQDPCPENEEGVRAWYGLKDERGTFIPNFYICPRDKNCMELLFPTLTGTLSRRQTTNTPKLCAFRIDSSRFPIYFDVLDAMHDSAMRKQSSSKSRLPGADISHLIDLASTLAGLPECPRNRPTINSNWHFNPSEPNITVCSECYDSVIGPDARRGVPLAVSFVQTPRPVMLPASRSIALLPTCQLYSSRMRGVWDAAVEDMAPEFFMSKARDRRLREMDLMSKIDELRVLLNNISRGDYAGTATSMDKDRVKREIFRLEQEWRKHE